MTRIISYEEINEALEQIDAVSEIEAGFAAFSQGRAVIPPVGELVFDNPPGEMHIKYGYIRGEEYYVIKIAGGFYENTKLGLPKRHGMMLVFEQKSGRPVYILDDKGLLTDVRTGAAGAVVAKYLAPKNVKRIGIIGAGGQGRMQAQFLREAVECDDLLVWGVDREELERYKKDMKNSGYYITTTLDTAEVASTCNLIVTVTPSTKPLLTADQIRPGTHISAFGSDTPEKTELDPQILRKADVVVADSLAQSQLRGEIHHARKAGCIRDERIVELGDIVTGKAKGRTDDTQITVTDLTGVAVQDIQIAKAVCKVISTAEKR
jgi:ornithine cyclodeaminase